MKSYLTVLLLLGLALGASATTSLRHKRNTELRAGFCPCAEPRCAQDSGGMHQETRAGCTNKCWKCGPAAKTVASGWQDESYGFIDNKHNLPNTPVVGKTLQECIDVCKAEQDCKAFSYEKPGNGEPKPTSDCWLKDSTEHESRGNRIGKVQHWFTYVVRNEPAELVNNDEEEKAMHLLENGPLTRGRS